MPKPPLKVPAPSPTASKSHASGCFWVIIGLIVIGLIPALINFFVSQNDYKKQEKFRQAQEEQRQMQIQMNQNQNIPPVAYVVDPLAKPALLELTSDMSLGMKGREVQALDDVLMSLEVLGSSNSLYDNETEMGVTLFQQKNGLRPDGKVGPQTRFLLNMHMPKADIPRIMYHTGSVNQHWNLEKKQWESDPDGASSSDIEVYRYCKKWYPNTVGIAPYQYETIDTWREKGNGETPSTYLGTGSIACLYPGLDIDN